MIGMNAILILSRKTKLKVELNYEVGKRNVNERWN